MFTNYIIHQTGICLHLSPLHNLLYSTTAIDCFIINSSIKPPGNNPQMIIFKKFRVCQKLLLPKYTPQFMEWNFHTHSNTFKKHYFNININSKYERIMQSPTSLYKICKFLQSPLVFQFHLSVMPSFSNQDLLPFFALPLNISP